MESHPFENVNKGSGNVSANGPSAFPDAISSSRPLDDLDHYTEQPSLNGLNPDLNIQDTVHQSEETYSLAEASESAQWQQVMEARRRGDVSVDVIRVKPRLARSRTFIAAARDLDYRPRQWRNH